MNWADFDPKVVHQPVSAANAPPSPVQQPEAQESFLAEPEPSLALPARVCGPLITYDYPYPEECARLDQNPYDPFRKPSLIVILKLKGPSA